MYVCICARVKECDVRRAIRQGARCEDSVGDACGAGTGCGTCLERISDLIDEESAFTGPVPARATGPEVLLGPTANTGPLAVAAR